MVTNFLQGKKILLGVTGGIAAYKSAELLRLLIKEGAEVRVIMTSNAAKFVAPLTFRTLSGYDVVTDVFTADSSSGIDHIEHTDWADIFVIAPATANMIGKLASGIGDDALSTLALAFDKPFLIGSMLNIMGYFWAFITNERCPAGETFIKFVRSEQKERLRSFLPLQKKRHVVKTSRMNKI